MTTLRLLQLVKEMPETFIQQTLDSLDWFRFLKSVDPRDVILFVLPLQGLQIYGLVMIQVIIMGLQALEQEVDQGGDRGLVWMELL